MSDVGKAVMLAFVVTFLYLLWLGNELKYLSHYWRVIVYGKLAGEITNLAGLAIFAGGMMCALSLWFMLLLRKMGRRESGGMLVEAERGIASGTIGGVDRLRTELE